MRTADDNGSDDLVMQAALPADAADPNGLERNRLLRAMSPEDRAWLASHLEPVTFEAEAILTEPDEPLEYVHFPLTCVVSVVNQTSDAGTVEVGTVGNEGLVGLSAFLDAEAIPSRVLVQVGGEAVRMPAQPFAEGADERRGLRRLMHRYTQAFLIQVAQTASCNRAHSLDQRCARWLLMTHDRVHRAPSFPLRHEFLSFMLGVRRAGVSVALGEFQQAGLIRSVRGKITVLDRAGLEAASCECHGIVRAHYDRLLGPVSHADAATSPGSAP